ncbi:hypothetical protein P171DRAFT_60998 [Karstenula rhodostoma CBS 690.94]|uniref:Uncharacterized protein n=1 Tax=Karstenula rhodostoma CBS 690.94 TaxID=1392251 RepID=A0A9P4PF94_9PLEO|nr:hypothetical protein P171DRAFT_60998 [Karstenula rhodostoma CBS 690.94]
MCYYRLYIFLGCGHTTFSARPVRPCAAVRSNRISASQHHQQHADTAQGVALKVPPQAHHPPSTIAAAHAANTTFHTTHPSVTNPSPHPHTDGANNPQDSMTPRPADAAANAECAVVLTHPFQTLNIHTSCALCLRQRAALLRQLEQGSSTVRFEDWRWKVKYLSPTPEDAWYAAEWKNVGSAMGSWVKDWKVKRDEMLGGSREQVVDGEDGRRDSANGGMGLGIVGVLTLGRKKGRPMGRGSVDSGTGGFRGGVASS